MGDENLKQNIDDLLQDLHILLDEEPELPKVPSEQPEGLTEQPQLPEDLWEPEEEPPEEPVPEQPKSWTQTQKLPKHVAKLQNNQAEAYAQWLDEQEHSPAQPPIGRGSRPKPVPEEEPLPERKQGSGKGLWVYISVMAAVILLLLAAFVFVLPRQPQAVVGGLGERKDGVSTLLLVGMDNSGMRTDTLMLLTVDSGERSVRMVSIPRDVLVPGDYEAPKLNGVYGVNGGGVTGMEMLLSQVTVLIGFRPDSYLLLDMETVERMVDSMGGVDFDVPIDMSYSDPAQDLTINLSSGMQCLSGEQAVQVLCYQSGYTDGDLGRMQTQRAFMEALLKQIGWSDCFSLERLFRKEVQSDLTAANYLWLAKTLLMTKPDTVEGVTLPGSSLKVEGSICTVLDPAFVVQTVNAYCNPYMKDVSVEHLTIETP